MRWGKGERRPEPGQRQWADETKFGYNLCYQIEIPNPKVSDLVYFRWVGP